MANPVTFPSTKVPVAKAPVKHDDRYYLWTGTFNKILLGQGFQEQFKGVARFNAANTSGLLTLVGMMERDPAIFDLRWMAYMLATAYWETAHFEKRTHKSVDKKGKAHTSSFRVSVNMSPVEETGHGASRKYGPAVKILKQKDGTALITEQDGDQFTVDLKGNWSAVNKHARPGSLPYHPAGKKYKDAEGVEHAYYGRGYCQLTWWSNYANAGARLGRGLEFLFDPDKVMEPQTAYSIMSVGMRTGTIFANRHTLSKYFHGAHTDYRGARHMVNGHDHDREIADIAVRFEKVLYGARDLSKAPSLGPKMPPGK